MFAILSAQAQSLIIVPKGIKLTQDSTTDRTLTNSLNGFLSLKDGLVHDNKYVLKDHLPETAALLDEMKGISQNAIANDNNYYKPYLNNVTPLSNGDLLLQISYMAQADNIPSLQAIYQLIATRQDGQFYFYSPLQRQTTGWKIKKFGYITCHYKEVLNADDIKAYQQTIDFYNKKLNAPTLPIEIYYCNDFPEVLQILGVTYKASYNGVKSNVLTTREGGIELMINGWYNTPHRFDPHDLFHDRLRTVLSADVINRPVDEGCAYLYGGSWGYTWPEIKERFKKYLATNPNPDWLTLYINTTNFEAGQKPLKVGYVLNALIAQKLEKEKGMPAVLELLSCGKREQGDAKYFRALEKLTGISKADFNTRMSELVKAAY